ncbi:hypothetical protein LS482_08790 [Sinomicrobium kalidii]|uniref:hypothetical protein n=1 Tax=Sinomicrobium kalidii TaxID=2900738 RepID=UPI001E641765|nr:hypothetical protein [Sinomicrobium kalidii]UGU17964.1 hypothetical protein LS482_08790 [Sinomicrobium kalidii]
MKNLLFAVLFLSASVSGQEFNFDIYHTSLRDYLRMEEKLGSERIPTTSNHVSFSGDAQPIKFQRKENELPDLIVYYFFKEKDSSMSSVRYEWDVYNFEKKENNRKNKKFQKALIKKYRALEKEITGLYGASETEGDLSDLSKAETDGGLKKKNTWRPNDSTEIEMYTAISNFYRKKGMVTTNPTHRIRLYIRKIKKDKKEIPKLDSTRVTTLDRIAKDFFHALQAKNMEQSKVYLSGLIVQQVTDAQLYSITDNFNLEKETELMYSGVQLAPNGSTYTLLQYKHADDTSTPPGALIRVIFDEKDKIAGVQPVQLQGKISDK